MSTEKVIILICLIISSFFTILSLGMHFWLKYRRRNVSSFTIQNSRDGVWAFTKRNFWIFLSAFFIMMLITFASLLISTN